MTAVNTDPQDMRRLASEMRRADTEIAGAIRKVRSALNGARWDDPVRKKFEQQLGEMESVIKRFSQTAQESSSYLTRKSGELEKFLRA